jgi:hypothetical protein
LCHDTWWVMVDLHLERVLLMCHCIMMDLDALVSVWVGIKRCKVEGKEMRVNNKESGIDELEIQLRVEVNLHHTMYPML